MGNMWDERYSEAEFAYGKLPNEFFAQVLKGIDADGGNLMLPCEGEGRNAIHAAKQGWNVYAFDGSIAGKEKADAWADQEKLKIHYMVADAVEIGYPDASFDVIALIYAHFPSTIREDLHHKFLRWLRPGGHVILEAFNPNQLNYSSGGPKHVDMLYTKDMIEEDFDELNMIYLKELNIQLAEGPYHQGEAAVVRMVGQKPIAL